ncbi:MAG: LuxR C-terminal-related transcriptional regulator [Pirellulales bacterium]
MKERADWKASSGFRGVSVAPTDTPKQRWLALGASGYLLKGTRREALIKAIETAAAGETVWTRTELRRMSGALATPQPAVDSEVWLTKRERELLRQLTLGLTNEAIARVLNIGCETVNTSIHDILRKLGLTSRTQAAVWANRKGWV